MSSREPRRGLENSSEDLETALWVEIETCQGQVKGLPGHVEISDVTNKNIH